MMKMRWKKWPAGAMGLLLLAVLVPLGAAAQPEQVHAQELTGILSQTQPEATQGKEYVLDADITLDTNTLRQGLNPEDIRVFAGTLQGGGHTITVTGPEASAPLLEQLRGSVRGLNLVFTGDAAGTPFALDASYTSPENRFLCQSCLWWCRAASCLGTTITASTMAASWHLPIIMATGTSITADSRSIWPPVLPGTCGAYPFLRSRCR